MLPSTLDMVPSPSTWNPRPSTLDKKIDSSAMIPTQRSVIARLQYMSLKGGWSEDSLRKATRIRVFPRNAEVASRVFSTERKISSLWTCPAVKRFEQYKSLIIFSVKYSVKFVGSAISQESPQCQKWNKFAVLPVLLLHICHFIGCKISTCLG